LTNGHDVPVDRSGRVPMKGGRGRQGGRCTDRCRNAGGYRPSKGPEALSSFIAPAAAITSINICLCRRRRPHTVTAAYARRG